MQLIGDMVFDTYPEAAAQQARTGITPADPLVTPLAAARAQQDRYFQTLNSDIPEVAAARDVAVPGPQGRIPIRLVFPTTEAPLPCIVFLRGAGFWAGSIDSHARTIHTLARLSGCAVCAVDYRRTPEFTYPVQRDEVLVVLEWLRKNAASQGLRADEPVLFGESAGATLGLSAALALRDARGPLPTGLVLFYINAGGPKASGRAYSHWVWSQYVGGADPASVPGPVPMLQDMQGLPACWLACGEEDPLLEDTIALAHRLDAASVPHAVVRYPGMPHAFLMHSASLQPALNALQVAAAAARSFFPTLAKDTRS
ncbi:MAG: alpha/beta hydrolase [Acidovorax temperans]|uniref:alpha/beta hydrolase n=1 Tax=Acidovorax temperans TaxID=80878 RepID=UPI00391BC8ED